MSVICEGLLGGDIVLKRTLGAHPDANIEVEYQASPESAVLLVENCRLEAFEESLREDPTVGEVTTIARIGERRIYRIGIDIDRKLVVAQADGLGVQVLGITADRTAWRFRMRAQDREAVVDVRKLAETLGLEFRVETVYEETESPTNHALTPGQREVLVEAYESGYFDRPREASMAELADALDVSSSAVSGRLRRAMESIVEETVIDDRS